MRLVTIKSIHTYIEMIYMNNHIQIRTQSRHNSFRPCNWPKNKKLWREHAQADLKITNYLYPHHDDMTLIHHQQSLLTYLLTLILESLQEDHV